jgi:peptidoglycan hydrolase-like protein with peptidoglycan-binding domain
LQTQLKSLGYYFGSITGNFDEATEEALIEFQNARGLPGDGVAGKSTWDELFPDYDNLPSVGNRPVLRKGDVGEAVKTLQRELKKLMYYNGTDSGTFDDATLAAVKAFQANNGLGADGVVGEKTWAALQQLYPPVVSC